jgi:hypothetical protein
MSNIARGTTRWQPSVWRRDDAQSGSLSNEAQARCSQKTEPDSHAHSPEIHWREQGSSVTAWQYSPKFGDDWGTRVPAAHGTYELIGNPVVELGPDGIRDRGQLGSKSDQLDNPR